ncbi:glycosyltransferase family protein [Commensalibacter nepenthis]|uniref:Glycosyltransferase family 2 protein n=1 Tax=Commensalibacter nepenthis TaxID=3043872 RepID=A0ABT6Q5J5_9PROT|nr:hypothetical protein [Commensalibacter sp. TBRC 10068]MDI2112164.1 hypothetical protein [Commensalibacter sp. TBRC 10068]
MQNLYPRVAAFTLCYKEDILLPIWVNSYSNLVGRENLFILDHSNESPIVIEGIKSAIVKRPYYDEVERLNAVKMWQQQLLETYNWVIFSDTDEFIVFRPPSPNITIQTYLGQQTDKILRCIGVKVVDPENAPPMDWTKPILPQRPKGMISSWSCKALISSIPNDWNPGFHTTNSSSTWNKHFWLFHLKYADETRLMHRLSMTRQFEWSAQSIKAGFGGLHRVSDSTMRKYLNKLRTNQQDGTLDDMLNTTTDPNIISSPLMDIPQDLMSSL